MYIVYHTLSLYAQYATAIYVTHFGRILWCNIYARILIHCALFVVVVNFHATARDRTYKIAQPKLEQMKTNIPVPRWFVVRIVPFTLSSKLILSHSNSSYTILRYDS